jgi:2'-5' RNA ligase
VNEADLHLTIKFMGNVATQKVEAVSNAAALAVNGLAHFPIVFQGTGVFPGPRSPRVLWIGIADQTAGLAQLQSSLEQECMAAGFPEEERPFHPHLTIARIKEPQLARALATDHLDLSFKPVEMLVAELHVIRSQMSSKGSIYTVISRHPLS